MQRGRGGQKHNLPAQRTGLFGRDKDVAAVRYLVLETEDQLLTLTGAGGCGKTRLALQVGLELRRLFRRWRVAGRAGISAGPIAGARV